MTGGLGRLRLYRYPFVGEPGNLVVGSPPLLLRPIPREGESEADRAVEPPRVVGNSNDASFIPIPVLRHNAVQDSEPSEKLRSVLKSIADANVSTSENHSHR